MFSRQPIKVKLALCLGGLCFIILTLCVMVLRSSSNYSQLAHTLSVRAAEGPLSVNLLQLSGQLRTIVGKMRRGGGEFTPAAERDQEALRQDMHDTLRQVQSVLDRYAKLLDQQHGAQSRLADNRRERETLGKIRAQTDMLRALAEERQRWMLNQVDVHKLENDAAEFDSLAAELPSHLQSRMAEFRNSVHGDNRFWVAASFATLVLTLGLVPLLLWTFWKWIQQPLGVLIEGSRRVARNDFAHRVRIDSTDEMGELAAAMNAMIENFQRTRDDLDMQVRQRTAEVVRSERLASVGFLAAGVAHEINNPLASVAWAAEAMESRLVEWWDGRPDAAPPEADQAVLRKYLKRVQDEAFRCKGITDQLLDFSRMGDVEKTDADLRELVEGVIDMIRHLGKYRQKNIVMKPGARVVAPVNAQEIKQVVLNLITNGLDSLDPGGTVTLDLRTSGEHAELVVADDGCGMSDDVLKHLFEPFFTRRRDGSGTGLGLSITHRIVVDDHGGRIEAESEGSGRGSRFRVTLPLKRTSAKPKQHESRLQAA